ncbi:hypothetical protein [Catenulispora subtropica]|uniref:Signal transduction histidine kinase subgroup 3 dimerisation and phosphoacceptor domain-containing protein n=1 Tax=Catenulispora subtropica TaxID=450798 RepID=A0ABN2T6K3_9ACTN
MTESEALPLPAEQLAGELAAARSRIAELTEELEATNRGIIALHTDLEAARAAEARAAAEREVTAERDRIAAELRELVIQKIFATGMSLHGALGLIQSRAAADRVRAAVSDLDEVIAKLRTAVFGAEEQPAPAPGVSLRLNELVGEAARTLGFAPSLGFRGHLDESVPADLAGELVAAATVLLAGLRGTATRAAIHVESDTELRLLVECDGFEPVGEDLAALRARAAGHGGSVAIDLDDARTRILWQVPLPDRA